MKKRLVLKESVKKVMFYLVCGLAIVGCFKLLQLQDQNEYKRAVNRCGSKNNIVEHYTSQGDKYYSCKVEK